MAETNTKFWVSTGDIREQYTPVNIVATKVVIASPAFGQPDVAKAYKEAVDNLARAAIQLGANGVIWIRFTDPKDAGVAFHVYASGTAVQVSA